MIDRKESKAGNNLYLSLDSDLQIAVYNLLEQEIAGIVYSNIDNPSSDIPIPITDVYFALINNNVIDLSHFDSTDASTAEQSVSAIFSARQDVVKSQLREQLPAARRRILRISARRSRIISLILSGDSAKIIFLPTATSIPPMRSTSSGSRGSAVRKII